MQTSAAVKPRQTQFIPIEKIKPSPNNARKEFPPQYIAELAASVDRDGLQQPPKVRPVNGHFELIYGECRVRAHDLLKRKEVECFVETTDDATAERISLIENIKRRDLTVFEEARELKRLHETQKLKVDDLAVQVGLAVRTVRENIKLATVAPAVQQLVLEEKLKLSLAKLVSRLPRPDDQVAVAKRAVTEQLTHEDLEELIRTEYMADLRGAPFDVKAKGIPCLAESCAVCPRNAKNMKDELPDFKGGDTCTSLEHYRNKVRNFAREYAEKNGWRFEHGDGLFDRWGDLERSKPFVRADAQHPFDPKERPYRELVSKEELKKRLVVVVSPKNEVLELLDSDGIDHAIKAEGKLAKAKEAAKEPSAPRDTGKSREENEKASAARMLRGRTVNVVIPRLVEKIAKSPKLRVWQATASRLISDSDFTWGPPDPQNPIQDMPQLRGWETPEQAEKAIEKMDGQELAALIFQVVFGWQLGGVMDDYSEYLKDFCKLYGIDIKKAEAEVRTSINGRALAEKAGEKAAKAGVVHHAPKKKAAKKKGGAK